MSENSEMVDLLLAEFMRHLPNHKTFSTPKLRAKNPEILEPMANQRKAPAVLHSIFNSVDAPTGARR